MLKDRNRFCDANSRSYSRLKQMLDLADDVRLDNRRKDREDAHECRACFYIPYYSLNPCTEHECDICGKGIFSMGKLCFKCALSNELCTHCSGDINLNPNRKCWPT